jgi:2-polyprenyl-3-methyl-5-hydroxy-6-metoxy-1,4-benzoquinol methylase
MDDGGEEASMDEVDYLKLNREGWDRRAEAHIGSRFYDVEGFLAGKTSLREIELAELSGVAGKRLLHLQCHFGLDTLSWTRLGAECTGVDLSPVAIHTARSLAAKAGLQARFVCADVYGFERPGPEAYDIVFASYGALCWLPDLERWAGVVAANLKPGGILYLAEFHPMQELLAGYAYFNQAAPDVEEEGTYTENGAEVVASFATWPHPLSEVINALIGAGIELRRVNEYPFSPYDCFEGLVEREPGRYYRPSAGNDVPLVYTVTGVRT